MSQYVRDLHEAERQVEAAKKKIAFSDRVERLLANPDFKAIILEEYCVKEAARFVHQSANPIFKPQEREDALNMAQASGHLKAWLDRTQREADTLRDQLPQFDETILELRTLIDSGEEE